MPKKKLSLKRFFSAIGGGMAEAGGAAQTLGRAVVALRELKPQGKTDEVTQRLLELKRLETMREEELKAEREMMEEEWEEREELRRPLSERLSEIFYNPLKRPAHRLAGSLKGLSEDLYKANMRISPERYVALVIGAGLIVSIFAFLLMMLFLPFPLALLGGLVAFMFAFFFGTTRPKRKARARVAEVNRLIPYALRHLATQLSSGIGLPETMTSVSRADYGALSEEFERVIRDMNAGMSMEEALGAMGRRIDSEPLRRAIRQIQRTIRTGGDLSRILDSLASETAFEMRMKLRDYTQSLNLLTMIYMFASAIIPAMLMVTMAILHRMGGMTMTPEAAAVLYLVVIPFMLFYFVMMIRRFEPRL